MEEDDDNDSFITIDSDADSEATLEEGGGAGRESESSDSGYTVELQTNLREDFTITERAPTRAFSWLKSPTSAFTLC